MRKFLAFLVFAGFVSAMNLATAAELWSLGTRDGGNLEFGRKGAAGHWLTFLEEFPEPVVVRAEDENAVDQWPKFQPGPTDAWAGNRSHTYTILFDVPDMAVPEDAKSVQLILTLSGNPYGAPTLSVALNDVTRGFTLMGDADREAQSLISLAGTGNARDYTLCFPVDALREKDNQLTITSTNGSWFAYDAVSMRTSDAAPIVPVTAGKPFRGEKPADD